MMAYHNGKKIKKQMNTLLIASLFLVATLFGYTPVLVANEARQYECDRLAAHPNDPQRVTAGVTGATMDTQRAAEICKRDSLNNPSIARLSYQYARALNYLGRCEEAKNLYMLAIERGHYWGLYSLSTWANFYDGPCQRQIPDENIVGDLLELYIKKKGKNSTVLAELCYAYRSANSSKAAHYCSTTETKIITSK